MEECRGKVAVYYNNKDVRLEDYPEPVIGPGELKVKIDACGLCGGDAMEWYLIHKAPIVLGHEPAGIVFEVGEGVTKFKPGDRVFVHHHVACMSCHYCRRGYFTLCEKFTQTHIYPGAFAEYIALPMSNIWRHHPDIDEDIAAIFDPFGNAVHTALSFPVLGEDVLITGAGPIGLMAAAVVRHAGARFVVITDVNPFRLELAKKMGVTVALNVQDGELPAVQKQLGMTEGFDVGLEMSGNGAAFQDMLANMSHGARIALLGIPAHEMSINWTTVIFNMLTIKGIYGREMYETWYKMTVMLESGLDIKPVITHRLKWQECEKGFEAMRTGNCGKVILDWRE